MQRSFVRTRHAVFTALAALVVACLVAAAPARAVAPAKTPAKPAATAAAAKPAPAPAKRAAATEDSTMILKGGQEGTVFRSLTIEGEDRIHFEVERPELRLEIDPAQAPGLEWGTARDVLDRTVPDAMAPLLAGSASEPSPYTGRPWLSHFATGAVARFRPDVEGVESWTLTVANWRGETVTTFKGKGNPPREIAWDGRAANGAAVMPGRTYSYVFQAVDRAGNRRNFVGEGFRVTAFRVASESGTALVFTSGELAERYGAGVPMATGASAAPPVLLEAASWLNQGPATAPIVVTATARSNDEAAALAQRVQQQLGALLIGDTARMRTETRIESDAPPGGAVALVAGRAGGAPAGATPAGGSKSRR